MEAAVTLDVNTILQSVAILGIGGVGKMAYDAAKAHGAKLDSIAERLAQQNGRIGKLETWRDEHVEHSDEIIHGIRMLEQECKANMRRELDTLSDRISVRLGGGKG